MENCQVGVFAALGRGTDATVIEERLCLPEHWATDPKRCQVVGIPAAQRRFARPHDGALDRMTHARQQEIGFAGVGLDGFEGSDPAFLRTLDDQGEVFVGDGHGDQRNSMA